MSIFVKKFDRIEMRHPVDRIPANADTGRLAVAARRELPDCFVSECSGARDDANVAGLVNIPWHDTDFASTRSDDPRAIRSDQTRFLSAHLRFHTHHVHHRYPLRDANDDLDAGINSFKN